MGIIHSLTISTNIKFDTKKSKMAKKEEPKKAKASLKKVEKKAEKKKAKVSPKKVEAKKAKPSPKKVEAKKTKASPKKDKVKKTEASPKKETPSAFTKKFKLSADLAAIIGKKEASRPEITKDLWAYLKSNNLQDQENKQFFTPDKKMAKIFGKDKLKAFTMSKFINPHLVSSV